MEETAGALFRVPHTIVAMIGQGLKKVVYQG